jgi:tetratricopeptide (TPR) repeat protein
VLEILLTLSIHTWSSAFNAIENANEAYIKGNYTKAAEEYEKLIQQGYESAELYFNLGNAYYKMGSIGKCILNYERAKKLAPQDEDIAFNLNLANQQTLDKIEPAPKLFLQEWWDNLKNAHSEKHWAWRSMMCFALFFFFLAVFITSVKPINRQFGFWLAVAFLLLSVINFIIAKDRYSDLSSHTSAVILSYSAEVKNAPVENSTKLFILHEGTVVKASETKDEWVKIELTKEKVGWVKRSQIEFI